MQKFDRPNRMSFDLNNSKSWKPFFTKNFPNPGLPTVQVNILYNNLLTLKNNYNTKLFTLKDNNKNIFISDILGEME